MKDISKNLEYRGRTYKMVFNLNVMEEIQDKYGSFAKWGELTSGEEPKVSAVKFGVMAMLNEGLAIDNEDNDKAHLPFTLRQVGRMLTEIGVDAAMKQMAETVVASTQPGEDSKNA